jgi:hypothetical protein
MSVNNLFGFSTYLSNLKLVLTITAVSSLLSTISLLILALSHLRQKSGSACTKISKDKITPSDSPVTI